MALPVGSQAPDFRLPSTSGGETSLSDFRGRKVVLYFYPRDETPGCTREACGFRDNYQPILATGAEVLGVSGDSMASHDKFRSHHGLPFPLLSDPGNEVARAFGAYGEKNMYGRTVLGTIRSTYLIDENGTVAQVWSPVRVDGHVAQVVTALGGTPVASEAPAPAARPTPAASPAPKAARAAVVVKAASKSARKATRKAPARKAARKAPARKAARKAPARKATRKAPARKAARKAPPRKAGRR